MKENLAQYRIRKKSISHDKLSKKLKSHYDLFHICDEKPAIIALWYACWNMFYGILKKKKMKKIRNGNSRLSVKMENRLSIYVSSPDSYSDVFSIFLSCYKKNWPNCPYDFVLSTNTSSYDGITVYNNNNIGDGWVERTIAALKRIETKYILLMCDDLFITQQPDVNKIEEILDFMDQNNSKFCRLKPTNQGKKINNLLTMIAKRMPYGLNLQIGIFNKQFLLDELCVANETAWEVESRWIHDASLAPKGMFDDIVGVRKKVIYYIHGIQKSKWIPSSKRKIIKFGITPSNNRKTMTKKEVFVLNIKSFWGKIIPIRFRKTIKRILNKFGMNFIAKN